MLNNPHIRSQRVVVSVDRTGATKETLVIETSLSEFDANFGRLTEAVVEYLKTHPGLSGADIACVLTPS